jgi:hypothetical protein
LTEIDGETDDEGWPYNETTELDGEVSEEDDDEDDEDDDDNQSGVFRKLSIDQVDGPIKKVSRRINL